MFQSECNILLYYNHSSLKAKNGKFGKAKIGRIGCWIQTLSNMTFVCTFAFKLYIISSNCLWFKKLKHVARGLHVARYECLCDPHHSQI